MKNNIGKIGVATVYTGYNCGSALQAYATMKILSNLGLNPELLKLRGSLVKGRDIRLKKLITLAFRSFCHSGGIKCLKNYGKSIAKNLPDDSKALFNTFTSSILNPIDLSYSELSKRACTDEYKFFLCGSDQIWNSAAFYVDPFYYLQFAPENKRIAFAPSFGRDFVPDYNKKTISKYLSGIPHKSVRESSGVGIIKELTGDDAKVLLDPTLIIKADEWREFFKLKKNNTERYLLAYFLDTPSKLALDVIFNLSKNYGLKIVGLPYKSGKLPWDIVPAGPIEFVKYINEASFVCTDSFHGTAFSINFNVPFYTFERNYGIADKQSTRIESLLNAANMSDRFNPQKISSSVFDADFESSNKVLDIQRISAYRYLQNIL